MISTFLRDSNPDPLTFSDGINMIIRPVLVTTRKLSRKTKICCISKFLPFFHQFSTTTSTRLPSTLLFVDKNFTLTLATKSTKKFKSHHQMIVSKEQNLKLILRAPVALYFALKTSLIMFLKHAMFPLDHRFFSRIFQTFRNKHQSKDLSQQRKTVPLPQP